jgi:hypothetical protein
MEVPTKFTSNRELRDVATELIEQLGSSIETVSTPNAAPCHAPLFSQTVDPDH